MRLLDIYFERELAIACNELLQIAINQLLSMVKHKACQCWRIMRSKRMVISRPIEIGA